MKGTVKGTKRSNYMTFTGRLWVLLVVLSLIISCGRGSMNESRKGESDLGASSVDSATFSRISSKLVFFAHHSVGDNILDGVSDLMVGLSYKPLQVIESTNVEKNGVIYHSRVGKNGDPISKIEGFSTLVRNSVGNKADVAFFKFCYVDFSPETDAEAVFMKYRETIDSLQDSYPNTRFIHVTVPLTTQEYGLKTFLKGILGRINWEIESNLVRERFNRMIREEYAGQGLVFDLASVESTLPDGKRLQFQHNGEMYYALAPEYTIDGGHLNSLGRRRVATEFLRFLGSLD